MKAQVAALFLLLVFLVVIVYEHGKPTLSKKFKRRLQLIAKAIWVFIAFLLMYVLQRIGWSGFIFLLLFLALMAIVRIVEFYFEEKRKK
jgi:hypothetical protein